MEPKDHDLLIRLDENFKGLLREFKTLNNDVYKRQSELDARLHLAEAALEKMDWLRRATEHDVMYGWFRLWKLIVILISAGAAIISFIAGLVAKTKGLF